ARDILNQALGDDYIVALNLAPATPTWLRSIGAEPMKLGLDLRGGVHFLMEVDMDEALTKIGGQTRDLVRTDLRDQRIRYTDVSVQDNHIVVKLRTAEDFQAAENFLDNKYPGYVLLEDADARQITLQMTEDK